eukprot:symbB.v1.2.017826.t1/scaffold1324.1/size125322/8
MGTLLIAAARVWPQLCQKRLRLIGREMNPNQLKKCYSNFSSCHLDTGDLRLGDARDGRAFAEVADASVDALLCDLPSGGAHKASRSASSDWESYTSFMKLAERIVCPPLRAQGNALEDNFQRCVGEGGLLGCRSWAGQYPGISSGGSQAPPSTD